MSLDKKIIDASISRLPELVSEIRNIAHEIDSTMITICGGKAGHEQFDYMQHASMVLHETIDGDDIDLDKIIRSISLVKDISSVAEISTGHTINSDAYEKIEDIISHVRHLEDEYNNKYGNNTPSNANAMRM